MLTRKTINWSQTITIEQYKALEEAGEMDRYPLTENGIRAHHATNWHHGMTGPSSLQDDRSRLLGGR